jgi:hypothetical protein
MLFSLYTLRGSYYRTPIPMVASLEEVQEEQHRELKVGGGRGGVEGQHQTLQVKG